MKKTIICGLALALVIALSGCLEYEYGDWSWEDFIHEEFHLEDPPCEDPPFEDPPCEEPPCEEPPCETPPREVLPFEEPAYRTHNIHGGLHRFEHAGSVAYLFGSLHGGLQDWFPLAYAVETAMRRADIFAFEIDFSISSEEMSQIASSLTYLPDGQTVSDILCEDLYAHYMTKMANWSRAFPGIMDGINYVNPSFLIFSLQQALLGILADIDINMSGITVDGYIMSFAQENEIPVIGLMDFEAQQRVVLTPPQEIMLYMVYYLTTFEEFRDELRAEGLENLNQLVYYYLANDAEGLAKTMHYNFDIETEQPVDRYNREVVLNDRSVLFATELIRHMEEADRSTTFFVTLGKSHLVRHLAGPYFTSTIEQLELMGIDVVPIK